MPKTFAIVCEALADFQTASGLAERIVCEDNDWLASVIEYCPIWRDFGHDTFFITWSATKAMAAEQGIRAHGHFNGEAGVADASAGRRALLLLKKIAPEIDGVILLRDSDGDTDRMTGLTQAREAVGGSVVLGVAQIMRENWVCSGWEPLDENESEILANVRRELGFDPRNHSHELTANDEQAKKSPKRILRLLTGADKQRELACWAHTSLADLRLRGENNGLASYLEEVSSILSPIFRETK